MIDIQMVACFNTRSPILHLFLQSNAKYITIVTRYSILYFRR